MEWRNQTYFKSDNSIAIGIISKWFMAVALINQLINYWISKIENCKLKIQLICTHSYLEHKNSFKSVWIITGNHKLLIISIDKLKNTNQLMKRLNEWIDYSTFIEFSCFRKKKLVRNFVEFNLQNPNNNRLNFQWFSKHFFCKIDRCARWFIRVMKSILIM